MPTVLENLNLSSDQSASEPRPHSGMDTESLLTEARRLFSLHEYLLCEELVQQVLEREPNHPKAQGLLELTNIKLARQKLYKKMVPERASEEAKPVADSHQPPSTGSHYQANRERTIAALMELFEHKGQSVQDWSASQSHGEGGQVQNEAELAQDPSHASEGTRVRQLILSAMNLFQEGKIPEALCVAKGVLLMMPDHPQAKEIVDLLQKYLDEAQAKNCEGKEIQPVLAVDQGTVTISSPFDPAKPTQEPGTGQTPVFSESSSLEEPSSPNRRSALKAKRAKVMLVLLTVLVVGGGSGGFFARRQNSKAHTPQRTHGAKVSMINELDAVDGLSPMPIQLDLAQVGMASQMILPNPSVPSLIAAPTTSVRSRSLRQKESASSSHDSALQEPQVSAVSSPLTMVNLPDPSSTPITGVPAEPPGVEITDRLISRGDEIPKLPAPKLETTVNEVNNAPAVQSSATTGTILWSGQLGKNDLLLIAGKKSSSGSAQGELPGVPVMLSIDTRGIGIVEAPGPRNDWKQLAIRNGNRTQSAVVIRWTVIQ